MTQKWDGRWVRRVALVALVLAACVAQGGAQLTGPPSECGQARTWHLFEAMRWSERQDQAYHLGAAEAARQLADDGATCDGWEADAEAATAGQSNPMTFNGEPVGDAR